VVEDEVPVGVVSVVLWIDVDDVSVSLDVTVGVVPVMLIEDIDVAVALVEVDVVAVFEVEVAVASSIVLFASTSNGVAIVACKKRGASDCTPHVSKTVYLSLDVKNWPEMPLISQVCPLTHVRSLFSV
jgi:hypothetical protein